MVCYHTQHAYTLVMQQCIMMCAHQQWFAFKLPCRAVMTNQASAIAPHALHNCGHTLKLCQALAPQHVT